MNSTWKLQAPGQRKLIFFVVFSISVISCVNTERPTASGYPQLYEPPINVLLDTVNGYTESPYNAQPILVDSAVSTGKWQDLGELELVSQDVDVSTTTWNGNGYFVPLFDRKQSVTQIPEKKYVDWKSFEVDFDKLEEFKEWYSWSESDSIELNESYPAIVSEKPCIHPKPIKALPPEKKDYAKLDISYFGIAQGLNFSSIQAIEQDSIGNIWIAGAMGGLTRYDGVYLWNYGVDQGLPLTSIDKVINFHKGQLLFSGAQGFSIYNGDSFTSYLIADNPIIGNLTDIAFMADGTIVLVTINGLLQLKDGVFKPVLSTGYNSWYLKAIEIDDQDNLWLLYYSGLYVRKGENSGYKVSSKSGIVGEDLFQIHVTDGTIWVSGWFYGLFGFHGDSVVAYNNHNLGVTRLDIIPTMEIDADGSYWFGTYGGGVVHYTNREVHQITTDDGLTNNGIQCSKKLNNGVLLFGTEYGGICIIKPYSFVNFTDKTNQVFASTIYVDSLNRNWSGNSKFGFWEVQKQNEVPGSFLRGLDDGFLGYQTNCITQGKNSSIWMGTFNGLYNFEGKIFTRYNAEGGYLNNVYSILPKAKNELWIGRPNGLTVFKNDSLFNFANNAVLRGAHIRRLCRANDGTNWIATWGDGLFQVKNGQLRQLTTSNGLICNKLTEVAAAADNSVWVGTEDAGLMHITNDTITAYTVTQGLLSNKIMSIVEDKKKRVWVATDKGLNMITTAELASSGQASENPEKVYRFTDNNGLTGVEFYVNSVTIDSNNVAWWTTKGNISALDLDAFELSNAKPVVDLINLEVQGQDINYKGNQQYLDSLELDFEKTSPQYNYPINPVFNPAVNHLTFHYTAKDWLAPDKIRYSYRMLGQSANWSTPTNDIKVDYRNLSFGDYEFQVMAIGESQQWGPVFNYPFKILPPFYLRWWAILIYVIAFVITIYLVVQWRTLWLRKQRSVLKKQVALATEEIRDQKETIEREKKRSEEFMLNITHEFKTPLTLVLGPLENLYDRIKDIGDKNLINTARKNAADLLYLINQLLDINKIGQQKMTVNYSHGDFASFVAEICEKARSMAKANKINLVFSASPKEIETHFDGRKTERIVINLLSNALKFAPQNSTVQVKLEANTKTIRLQVIDQGPGIPEDLLENIFTQFYQIDGSSTRKHGGTGIGLALVKEYAELLGAQVSVVQNNQGGSTFEVVFPVVESSAETEEAYVTESGSFAFEQEGSPKAEPVADEPDENTPLVLIAEDNPELNDYLRQCLQGYRILQAFDGKEAWQLAQSHIPDLLITDVMMPEMTGVELCAKMKQDELTSHIPVIVLTAKSAIESRIEGLEAGADDYIAKPFNRTELLVRIKNLIELRKALREKYASSLQSIKPESHKVGIPEKDSLFIVKAESVIEQNLDDGDFDVMQFCAELNISRAQAHRKFKALTDLSVTNFIRSYRLKRAVEIMQAESLIVKEVAYRVGFNSPNYFTKCFHEQFGFPPTQIIN